MIKVLIVDDEHLVRIGLRMIIDWTANGFELMNEANCGNQALEIIKDSRPDIIITDIKMPEMDGIELIKTIQAQDSSIKFIVLSGYNDFELVREAMKLGAVDYLLKLSLNPQDLLEVLEKTKETIGKEYQIKENSINLNRKIHSNISDIKNKYFKRVFDKSDKNLEEFYSQLGDCLRIKDSDFVIILAKMDLKSCLSILERYPDKEHLKSSLNIVIKEGIDNYADNEVICISEKEFILIINIDYSHSLVKRICNGLNEILVMLFDIKMNYSVSDNCTGFVQLPRGYDQAQIAKDCSFFIPNKGISFYSKDEKGYESEPLLNEVNESIKNIYKSLSRFNEENVNIAVKETFKCIAENQPMPVSIVVEIMEGIILNTSQILKNHGLTWTDVSEMYKNISYILPDFDSIVVAEEFINNALSTATQMLLNTTQKANREDINKVIRFIANNYQNSISLDKIAKLVNMNEAYLSYVFSKEMDKPFTVYLMELRVDKAKKYLETSNYKVLEISRLVGYNDEHYFSKVFHKIAGKTPSEYRREYKNNTLY